MIVVDSSVWIEHLRNRPSVEVAALRTIRPDSIVAGDLIVLEVLRGLASEKEAVSLARKFDAYGITPMLDPRIAIIAAAYYRALRAQGITVRKTVDLIIATFCIERGHQLLHRDRDFDPFVTRFGLKVFQPG